MARDIVERQCVEYNIGEGVRKGGEAVLVVVVAENGRGQWRREEVWMMAWRRSRRRMALAESTHPALRPRLLLAS